MAKRTTVLSAPQRGSRGSGRAGQARRGSVWHHRQVAVFTRTHNTYSAGYKCWGLCLGCADVSDSDSPGLEIMCPDNLGAMVVSM